MIIAVYKDVLRSGRGADRATVALASALVEHGHTVHLVTKQPATIPLSVSPDARVVVHHVPEVHASGLKRSLNKMLLKSAFGAKLLAHLPALDLQRAISEAVRATLQTIQPVVILSEGPNEAIDLTYMGTPCAPFVQCFHVYPPACFAKNKYQRVTRFKAALQQAATCQVLLPSYKDLVRPYTSAPIVTIGNALSETMYEACPEPRSQHTLIYIAYFSKDKNHLQLLDAFAQVKDRGDWQLHLYGSGSPKWEQRLRARVKELQLEDCVRFQGVTEDSGSALRSASICAYPSRVEGFALALLEAMKCGLPCVGLRFAPGVNELILDGKTGFLADDTAAFASALKTLMDDASLRHQFGTAAAQFVNSTYTATAIWTQWEALLSPFAPKTTHR